MKSICIVVVLFGACAWASTKVVKKEAGYEKKEYSYETKTDGYGKPKDQGPTYADLYRGKYNGQCDKDGFYYKDSDSFVICSNNNAYTQPCAPGSRNSRYGKYVSGNSYGYRDFCDVNLVDYGYTGYTGYDRENAGYGGFDRYDRGYGYDVPSYDIGYGPGRQAVYGRQ